ncbi:hypothetical protein V6N11_043146 [Hibiscus sabdariffa]|uniref:Uncharacterized protein n=1 Tax=Hibiscus sabdariffa TaxID=183260 RepID=A0ABR2QZ01_9ROSI
MVASLVVEAYGPSPIAAELFAVNTNVETDEPVASNIDHHNEDLSAAIHGEVGVHFSTDEIENVSAIGNVSSATTNNHAMVTRKYNALMDNETWELIPLPADRRAIGCK